MLLSFLYNSIEFVRCQQRKWKDIVKNNELAQTDV